LVDEDGGRPGRIRALQPAEKFDFAFSTSQKEQQEII
jgi:hypothetical protein